MSGAEVDACGGTLSGILQFIWFLPRDSGGSGTQCLL